MTNHRLPTTKTQLRVFPVDTATVSVEVHHSYILLSVHFELDDTTSGLIKARRTPAQAKELARRLIVHADHTKPIACLYCGDTEDIFETPVTIDERTTEYALQCGRCGGMWAQ